MANIIKPQMVRILNSLSIDMVLIKKGSFLMGEGSEQKKVTIENDFYIGKYPVTVAEYMHFVNDTNSHYPEWLEEGNKYNIKTGTDGWYKRMPNLQNPNAPIVGISWNDAVAYCKWLSEKTGDNYKLPKEAEWEYSCRAGTKTKWSFGNDKKELDKYAWYDENFYDLGKKHKNYGIQEVGKKLPNPWGLYDMHGNVWEWCEDWYGSDKNTKVLRGGSWYNGAFITRSAFRYWNYPQYRYVNVGFRLLRTLPS